MSLIIAHRGASTHAPENTLDAFGAAIQSGADWIELDVRFSRDGVPVVIHDSRLDRTTSGSGPVRKQTYAELSQLEAGSWFSNRFEHCRLPTLHEALEFISETGTQVLLEIKPVARADRARTGQLMLELSRSSWRERLIIESFDYGLLVHIRSSLRGLATAALFRRWRPDWVSRAKRLDAQFLCPKQSWVSERVVRKSVQENLQVLVWTVDDPTDASRFFKWGVSGVITNDPARLVSLRQSADRPL